MEIRAISRTVTKTRTGAIIVGAFQSSRHPEGEAIDIDRALGGTISELLKQGDIKGKPGEITLLHTAGSITARRVAVVGLGKRRELTANKVRAAAAEACRYLRGKGVDSLALTVLGAGINRIKYADAAQAVTEGAILGLYTFRRHMTKNENNSTEVEEVKVVGRDKRVLSAAIERGRILAEAANWVRDLVNEPSNYMTPNDMAEAARKIAADYGLEIEVFDRDTMAEMEMGALLGVAQGSQQPPVFIVLKYKGGDPDKTDLVLAGKGITFDSGGINIKPSEAMNDMKGDMAGGASVMGAMIAVSQLKPSINVTALVPSTENMPGGSAMKPGDVVTAMNGKTIEVLNTDAEGRLILSDALSYAVKLGAGAIIDVATLTGACRVALGNICTGAFTNNQALMDTVLEAAAQTGEYTWQMPMYPEYREMLKSDIADIKNIGNRYAGAITAAKFLGDFVGNTPWVHLDIAGTSDTDKDRGFLVKGATGVPVRTLVGTVLSMAKK